MGIEEIKVPIFLPQEWDNNALWICMTATELKQQYSNVGRATLSIGNTMETFKFLAPETLMENINHEWTEYESMQSRLAEKLIGLSKLNKDIEALSSLRDGKFIQKFKNKQFDQIVPGAAVPKMKIDTPLVYSSSSRREWTFEFHLLAYLNPMEIIMPVQKLMDYSSADLLEGTSINIDLPYIFNVYTYPDNFIQSKYTALTSVQPTWEGPYIGGKPSSCKLTLTFKDLSPLFRSTLQTGSKVNVIK